MCDKSESGSDRVAPCPEAVRIHNARPKEGIGRAWTRKEMQRFICLGLVLLGLGAGCASGPVELLDELGVGEADCDSRAECTAQGDEALKEQDFVQAMAFFHQGCRAGETSACRRLGDGYARGDGG